MDPHQIVWLLWAVWYAYWIVSARNRIRGTGESEAKRESLIGRLGYMAFMIAGFALLIWHVRRFGLGRPMFGWQGWSWLGLVAETAGLALAVWARQTLGKNWTGRITTGGTQELIIRGPYRVVRHPIYSGGLLAVLGTAIVIGEPRALLGFLLFLAGLLIKLRREEAALRKHFGSAYEDYARQVAGLVPGVV